MVYQHIKLDHFIYFFVTNQIDFAIFIIVGDSRVTKIASKISPIKSKTRFDGLGQIRYFGS